MPSQNAIFFSGDRVQGTGNPVIEKLSNLQTIAETLVSKLGDTTNAWVIEASTFKGPFAVYKDFVPSVDRLGEPQSYDATGFPASKSVALLLSNCLKQVYFIFSQIALHILRCLSYLPWSLALCHLYLIFRCCCIFVR